MAKQKTIEQTTKTLSKASKPAPKRTAPSKGKSDSAAKPRRSSGLDAAANVLKAAGKPMGCKDIVQTMLDKGMWKTEGKTPAATIYSAILREIQKKKGEARFKKTERGMFTFNG